MQKLFAIVVCVILNFTAFAQSFNSSKLAGESINNPTSLQFGPDGRLYASQQDGTIFAYTINRNGANDYQITATETISVVKQIQNHNDDGTLNNNSNRQITGLLVIGSASKPILYVSSSDPRIGGGGGGSDIDLDTNSGVISRLTKNGNNWEKIDLIRGLPRSEENHANNGLQIDQSSNTLYVTQGGHTNAGAPSNNFAFITEYALSAAILTIDLNVIDALPVLTDPISNDKYVYDLPTLDDPTRSNTGGQDINDPFGGNDGLNQAKLVPGGPVQIYATGFRNPYDIVLAESGKLYTWDNGANSGWGGHPDNEGGGNATNNWVSGEPGSTGAGPNDPKVNNLDGLHFITKQGYYGGHPNPIRANPAGAGLFTHDSANGSGGTNGVWRTAVTNNVNTTLPVDWPPYPVNLADPIQGDFQNAGETDASLFTVSSSANGMTEYTASNFGNALKGNLLACTFNGNLYNVNLNQAGSINNDSDVSVLASGFGSTPLDVTAQGDSDIFPGTIWVANIRGDDISILEPTDYGNDPTTSGDAIYINAGGPAVSTGGIDWLADQSFSGGTAYTKNISIAGTTNDVLYKSERYGTHEYNIAVNNGAYSVQLHFAEIYGGAQTAGIRVFDVSIENDLVLNNFDIAAESGYTTATIQTFTTTVTDGSLNISFENVVENAKISAIAIIALEQSCEGNLSASLDEDGDGFTNSDEIANGTNPCNGADQPTDFDGTLIGGFKVSNLNDPDDDDDGINDKQDLFVLDPQNGLTTNIPISYPLLNTDPGQGFFGLGFTGLMSNGTTDYLDLIKEEDNSSTEIIAGGAVGLFTLNGVPSGDAILGVNTQQNAFQFGVNVNNTTAPFIVESKLLGPIFSSPADKNQAAGFYIGKGDQDNYLKMTVYANNGSPVIQVLYENEGTPIANSYPIANIGSEAEITFFFKVDPATGLVQPQYAFINDTPSNVGPAIQLGGPALQALQSKNKSLAIGLLSTTYNSNSNFNATWDYFEVYTDSQNEEAALIVDEQIMIGKGTNLITLNHSGENQEILIEAISFSGSNNFAYNSFKSPPFILKKGESFEIEVSYSGTGNETAKIDIDHNGSNGKVTTINLSTESSDNDNIAPLGTASQSSTLHSGSASRAIDKKTNGNWSQESVTHTKNEANAWWQVEWNDSYRINQIKIYNRTDCCTDRLSDFTVYVLDNSGNTVFSKSYNSAPNPSMTIDINGGAIGHSVKVQLEETNVLSLAEVEVYGVVSEACTATTLPAKIEAEDFCTQQGVKAQSTKDVGGGQNIGYVTNGDWMDYQIKVATAGTYQVDYRVAAKNASGGTIQLQVNGSAIGSIDIPSTNGWQDYTTISNQVNLAAGTSTLRIFAEQGGWNLNWIEFSAINDNAQSFIPNPNKTYYLDVPAHNLRLAATGQSDDPYTTSTNTTGADVAWKFVDKGNGYWHMQRAAGGSKPGLRFDGTLYADMQTTNTVGRTTYYRFDHGATSGTHYITLPDGLEDFQRLQMTKDGALKFVTTTNRGTWVSWNITEATALTNVTTLNASSSQVDDCTPVNISASANAITVSNLIADAATVQILDKNDAQVAGCTFNCSTLESFDLPAGTYRVSVKKFNTAFAQICEKFELVTIGGAFTSEESLRLAAVSTVTTQTKLELQKNAKAPMSMKIAPNPVRGQFSVNFQSVKGETYHLSVIDLLSKVHYEQNFIGETGNMKLDLNSSTWEGGLYFLVLESDLHAEVKQMVIVK